MKELKKLRLNEFKADLKKSQMRSIAGGASTSSFGYTTTDTRKDSDSSSGDSDASSIPVNEI